MGLNDSSVSAGGGAGAATAPNTAATSTYNNNTTASNSAQCNDDDAAVGVRRHMERLSGQWLGVLQEQVYARLMGHLFECILREAMRPLLTAECIAEAEGAEISRVFRSLQMIR